MKRFSSIIYLHVLNTRYFKHSGSEILWPYVQYFYPAVTICLSRFVWSQILLALTIAVKVVNCYYVSTFFKNKKIYQTFNHWIQDLLSRSSFLHSLSCEWRIGAAGSFHVVVQSQRGQHRHGGEDVGRNAGKAQRIDLREGHLEAGQLFYRGLCSHLHSHWQCRS